MSAPSPILITYRTQKVVPRDGLFGFLARSAQRRPILVGFVGGALVNVVALLKAPGVIESAPAEAFFLGMAVMTAWVVLFRMMQPFFSTLAVMEIGVVRALAYDHETFRAYEAERVVCELKHPRFRLVVAEAVPASMLDVGRSDQAWPGFLVVENDDGRFVIETRLSAHEASGYGVEEWKVDDNLPTPVISSLLELARHAPRSSAVPQV